MTDQEIEELLSQAQKQVERVEPSHELVTMDSIGTRTVDKPKVRKSFFQKLLVNFVYPIVIGVLAAVLLTQVIFFHANVPSGSMENTIMTDDMILGTRFSYWGNATPDYGDIIIFWSEEYKEFMVKRVIGRPGDTVEIKNDRLYVNNRLVRDAYTVGKTHPLHVGESKWEVPEKSYFVMGDNRENSADSRYWINAYVPEDEIYAKYLFRYRLNFRTKDFAFAWTDSVDFWEE